MSELAVFARQGDISRSSNNKTQKRPLSIITENEGDDPETLNYLKYQECSDSGGKDNTSLCHDVSESSENIKSRNAVSEASDQAEPAFCVVSASDNKGCSESSFVTLKPNLTGTQSSAYTTKSRKSTSSPCLSEASASFVGLLSSFHSENNVNRIKGEAFSKLQSEKSKFPRLIISQNENFKQQSFPPFVNIQNDVLVSYDITQTNNTAWPKSCGDGQSMARIRETVDRFHLISSQTTLSSSSTSVSSKFGQRLWPQTSTLRTVHQSKNHTGQNYQQLTNGGTPLVVSLTLTPSPDDASDNSNNKFLSDINDNNALTQSPVSRTNIFSNSKLNSSKMSSYFSRRMSNESTGSLSEGDLSDGDIQSDDGSQNYLSYFRRLKETTDRLRLSARRPSIMLWRQQYMECQESSMGKSHQGDVSDERLTLDRKQRIDLSLEWLRNQLQEMRSQDQNLAKQLLAIRHDIHKLKLQRSTEEHQDLIDDFQFELQELQEFSDVLDLPLPEYADNPLKHIGVTRLNISARRFSAC